MLQVLTQRLAFAVQRQGQWAGFEYASGGPWRGNHSYSDEPTDLGNTTSRKIYKAIRGVDHVQALSFVQIHLGLVDCGARGVRTCPDCPDF